MKAHFNRINRSPKNNKIIQFGEYKITDMFDNFAENTECVKSIDEFAFYKTYLLLNNVIGIYNIEDNKNTLIELSQAPIDVMATIMTKPLDYSILYRNKDSRLENLGIELNRTTGSIYASINKLRKCKYLIMNEDDFYVPNEELNSLRKQIKSQILEKGHIAYDYIFKFTVK